MLGKRSSDANQSKVVKTVCNMCMQHCGIDVYVENGRITKVKPMDEHPFHHLCIKPAFYPDLVHSKFRLTQPLKKVNGTFKEISWDEAFTIIVDKLTHIKEKYGAKAVVPFVGNGFACRPLTMMFIRRFADAYGTPNYITGGWMCFGGRDMGIKLTLGTFPNPDYSEENRCMVVWGKNPMIISAPERHSINVSAKRGAKLIVIDPIATELAKKADLHAQIRPGTDCALALGLLNVIIEEELYDKDFVEKWTVGFDQLIEKAKAFTPAAVEEITWVPAETIRRIAKMYVGNHPASITFGASLEHSSNGIQALRAICSLMAVCGNLEVPGGNITYPGVPIKGFRLADRIEDVTPVGADFPLYTQLRGQTSGTKVTDIILTEDPYPIKSVLVIASNPLVTWANSNKVKAAFEKLEFLLVQDLFMTDTAKMADIVLPGASALETEDIRTTYFDHNCLPLILKTNRAIPPVGNCKEDWKIWAEVGRRMGYGEFFPWENSDELIKHMLGPSKFTLEELNKYPGGIIHSEKNAKYYLKGGFKTPSKKVEIYSETMAKLGYDPVPTFLEPVESPISQPDLAKKYPFIFIAGTRIEPYTHSRFREIDRLKEICPEPYIQLNTQTARGLGISDGDRVAVDSPRGRVQAAARVSDDVLPKVVVLITGWSNDTEANANCLTNDDARDPVSGYPEFKASLCNVTKCAD
jgi:anaerobic selenocysteine-containing dehydrogenase